MNGVVELIIPARSMFISNARILPYYVKNYAL